MESLKLSIRLFFSIAQLVAVVSLLFGCGSEASVPNLEENLGGASPVVPKRVCETDDDCDDGNACTGQEECNDEGFCEEGESVVCDDGADCTRDFCDPASGQCTHVAPDLDGDGHADAACKGPDGASLGVDCDDEDNDRFPGNSEVCSEHDPGHDEDCDPFTVGHRDADRDGFVDHLCRNEGDLGEVFRGEDCDDTVRSVNPNTSEVCDGFDNNCDGQVDEGLLIAGYWDGDGDGIGVTVTSADILPGTSLDEEGRLIVCPGTPGVVEWGEDCDDENPLINDQVVELCDGIDNDCDGEIDENVVQATWYRDADGDGFGNASGPLRVSCEVQVGYSLYPSDCDDSDSFTNPNQNEICDGKDNDCDGQADFLVESGNYEDDDGDGAPDPACGTAAPDCDDENVDVRPGAPELCDGLDNDCNGVSDTQTQSIFWYVDADGDGWGNPLDTPLDSCDVIPGRVAQAGDCDDRDPNVNPGMADDCTGLHGINDDCDEETDEDEVAKSYYFDNDGDGYGAIGGLVYNQCAANLPAGFSEVSSDCNDFDAGVSPESAEVCTPGDDTDDDCDGFVDCEDTDCAAHLDCVALNEVLLVTPSAPVVGFVAAPLTLKVAVENSIGARLGGVSLEVHCSDGAVATTSSTVTQVEPSGGLQEGEAEIEVYLGLQAGIYSCSVSDVGDGAVPLSLNLQAVSPIEGTIHTTFNVTQASGEAITGDSSLFSPLNDPRAVEVGDDGSAYVLDRGAHEIYQLTPRGVVTPLFASMGVDGAALLGDSSAFAMDMANDVLFFGSSAGGGGVFQLNLATGGVTQIAGGGIEPYFEGMGATSFDLGTPLALHYRDGVGVAFADDELRVGLIHLDGTLSLWERQACSTEAQQPQVASCTDGRCALVLAETGAALSLADWCPSHSTNPHSRIARLMADDSDRELLTDVAGGGTVVPLAQLSLNDPRALEFDRHGHLLVVDGDRVRHVNRVDQIARDLVGGASATDPGDHISALDALLAEPTDVAVAPDGSLWIVTAQDRRVRRVWRPPVPSAASSINLILESSPPVATTGYSSTPIQVSVEDQEGVPLPGFGIVFEGDASADDRQGPTFSSAGGVVTKTLTSSMSAGSYNFLAVALDIHGASIATLPFAMEVTDPSPGSISSVINIHHLDGLLAETDWAPLQRKGQTRAADVRVDGTIYFADSNILYAIGDDGTVRRVACGGVAFPDNVAALAANLSTIYSIRIHDASNRAFLLDASFSAYVLELDGGIIWKIATVTSDVYTGDVSPDGTEYVFVSQEGMYSADLTVHPPTVTQVVSVSTDVATNCSVAGRPHFADEKGVAYGADGLVYALCSICDGAGWRYDGIMSFDTSGQDVYSEVRPFAHSVARDMDFDDAGWLYFANRGGHSILRWDGTFFELVAGVGSAGDSGDLGPAMEAHLSSPEYPAVTPDGDVIFASYDNRTIRRVWMP